MHNFCQPTKEMENIPLHYRNGCEIMGTSQALEEEGSLCFVAREAHTLSFCFSFLLLPPLLFPLHKIPNLARLHLLVRLRVLGQLHHRPNMVLHPGKVHRASWLILSCLGVNTNMEWNVIQSTFPRGRFTLAQAETQGGLSLLGRQESAEGWNPWWPRCSTEWQKSVVSSENVFLFTSAKGTDLKSSLNSSLGVFSVKAQTKSWAICFLMLSS